MAVEIISNPLRVNVLHSDEIDHHTAAAMRADIDAAAAAQQPKVLRLDFSDVSFMDSSGLGVLLGRYKRVAAKGNRMYLYGANKTVDKLLKMSGIYSLIERL